MSTLTPHSTSNVHFHILILRKSPVHEYNSRCCEKISFWNTLTSFKIHYNGLNKVWSNIELLIVKCH